MRRDLLKTCNFLVTLRHVFKLCHLIYNSIKFEKKIKLNHIHIQNGNNLFLFHLHSHPVTHFTGSPLFLLHGQ